MPLIDNPQIDKSTDAYKLAEQFYQNEVKYDISRTAYLLTW